MQQQIKYEGFPIHPINPDQLLVAGTWRITYMNQETKFYTDYQMECDSMVCIKDLPNIIDCIPVAARRIR